MKIENVKVYDLEECIIASAYPMMTDLDNIEDRLDNIHFWLNQDNFLKDFIDYQKYYMTEIGNNTRDSCIICGSNNRVQKFGNNNNYYCGKHLHDMYRYGKILNKNPKYTIYDTYSEITIYGNKEKETTILLDNIDIPKFFYEQWNFDKYCKSQKVGLLHRFIFNEIINDDDIIDHINRDTLDNRRKNLRICNKKQNTINSNISKNNQSGFIGVSWASSKGKWRAYITNNNNQTHVGYFDKKEDAIIARLKKEKEIFGEFAPQRHLFELYKIDNIIVNSEDCKSYNLNNAIKDYNRIIKLAQTQIGEGHNQALTGIRVNFDLTFTNKAWVELERYRFIEFVSSQSTMHRITKLDIKKQCNKYVWDSTIQNLETITKVYNSLEDKNSDYAKEMYLEILYNVPSGFELTARLTTNYRSLKGVYSQRKNHRLPEWREFCQWIETLPHSELIIG